MSDTKKAAQEPVEGLFAKLLHAATTAKAVEKAGRNQGQGYNYAKAEDVIREAQAALHAAGLVGFMVPGERTAREVSSSSGSGGLFVTLDAKLVIIDPASGEEPLEIAAIGTGIDYPGDKAIYKAMTGAAKYAYASALGIPFGDDPEEETAGAGQERAPGSSDELASGPQKGMITRLLNAAGIPRETQFELIEKIGGKPLTKRRASAILDRIKPLMEDLTALRAEVEKMMVGAGVVFPSDLPAELDAPPSGGGSDQSPPPEEPFPTPEEAGEIEEAQSSILEERPHDE